MPIPTEDLISLSVTNFSTNVGVLPNQVINSSSSNTQVDISGVLSSGDVRYYPLNSNPSGYRNIIPGIPSGYMELNNGNFTTSWVSPVSPQWCILREDFIGGTNADGQRGELGWRGFTVGGTPTFTAVDTSSDLNHHGIISITTTAVANQGGSLALSNSSQPSINSFGVNGWDSYWVFKNNNPNNGRFRLGFSNAVHAGGATETNRGIWLRYDKDASYNDTGYYFVCRDNNINQQIPVGVIPDNNWHTLRIWCENTGFVNFALDSYTGSVTNTSNNGAKIPHMVILASSSSSVTSYIDYFGFMSYCGR